MIRVSETDGQFVPAYELIKYIFVCLCKKVGPSRVHTICLLPGPLKTPSCSTVKHVVFHKGNLGVTTTACRTVNVWDRYSRQLNSITIHAGRWQYRTWVSVENLIQLFNPPVYINRFVLILIWQTFISITNTNGDYVDSKWNVSVVHRYYLYLG